ncbi:hypothetical protein [Neobacillus bataviensis]|uniref:hypothetical protein n=1 Tax=Neobacillus bataviensis TaxID=220685 RepID=UPI00119EFB4F|nr:hypothetical protein [Neobacillus bataviensis]
MNKLYAIQDNGTSKETLWSIDTFANRLLLDQNTLFYYTRNTAGLEGIGAVDVKTGQSKWTYTLKQMSKWRVFCCRWKPFVCQYTKPGPNDL